MRLSKRRKDERRRPAYSNRPQGQAKVFSYYTSPGSSTGPDSQHPGRRQVAGVETKKSNIRVYAKIFLFSAVLLLFGVVTYIDPSSSRIVEGGDTTLLKDPAKYESSLQELMSKDLKSKSKFTIDSPHITEEFIRIHPEVEGAALSFSIMGKRPILHIKGHEPALVLDRPMQGKYILNKQGRVVAEFREVRDIKQSHLQQVVSIEDRSGVEVEVGRSYIASEEVYFIRRVYQQAEATGLKTSQILLPPLSRELHVRFVDLPSLYAKFYTGGDADVQFGTFRAVVGRINAGSLDASEYIDVRVAGRAFVK